MRNIDRTTENNMFEFDWVPSPMAEATRREEELRRAGYSDAEEPAFIRAWLWAKKASSDLTKGILSVAVNCYHIGLKLGLMLHTAYFVVGNIIPLAIAGVVASATGAGNTARSLYNKARDIANNNIRLAAVTTVLNDALIMLPTLRPWVAFQRVMMTVPAMSGLMLASAAAIWHDRTTRAMYNIGTTLGLINRDPELERRVDASIAAADGSHRMAQMAGVVAATAAATAVAPAVASAMAGVTWCVGPTALVTRPLVAAAGAQFGSTMYNQFRSSANSVAEQAATGAPLTQGHGLQEEAVEPTVAQTQAQHRSPSPTRV